MLTTLLAVGSLLSPDCPFTHPAGGPAQDAPRNLVVVLDGQIYRCAVPPKGTDSASPTAWRLDAVKPERILRMEVMKANRAQELFGDWASEGAVFIVTVDGSPR